MDEACSGRSLFRGRCRKVCDGDKTPCGLRVGLASEGVSKQGVADPHRIVFYLHLEVSMHDLKGGFRAVKKGSFPETTVYPVAANQMVKFLWDQSSFGSK